ncbi:hypothetical protein [Paraburkholderia caballeronis]|uniref:hypothetical protein n=1 Tax=Paraburkholderia caballeronis TaxID=416943 RepID=UPI003132ECF9
MTGSDASGSGDHSPFARATSLSRAASFPGGTPKNRLYSRLNCDGLLYPTENPTAATSSCCDSSRTRASCNRTCFWY